MPKPGIRALREALAGIAGMFEEEGITEPDGGFDQHPGELKGCIEALKFQLTETSHSDDDKLLAEFREVRSEVEAKLQEDSIQTTMLKKQLKEAQEQIAELQEQLEEVETQKG